MANIRSAIKNFVGKVKENYGYFKLGLKAEKEEQRKKLIERNKRWMGNIRKGTPGENLKIKGGL